MERSSKPYVQFLATLPNMIRECNQTLNATEILLKQRGLNIRLPTEVVVLIAGENYWPYLFFPIL